MSTIKIISVLCMTYPLISFGNNCASLIGTHTPPSGAVSLQVVASEFVSAATPLLSTGFPSGVDHCRVNLEVDVDPNDAGVVEGLLRLPVSTWNQKLYTFGQFGYGYEPFILDFFTQIYDFGLTGALGPLQRGYATLTSGPGHRVDPLAAEGAWGLDVPPSPGIDNEREKLFIGLATHYATAASKTIANAYYSQPPSQSIYFGCSTGGMQGMYLAANHPNDYDGMIVVTPDPKWTSYVWRSLKTQKNILQYGPLSAAQSAMVASVALSKCDGIDGIIDGVVQDAAACRYPHFVPIRDLPNCDTNPGPDCFTDDNFKMLYSILHGPLIYGGYQGLPPTTAALPDILGFHINGWEPVIMGPLGFDEATLFTRYFMLDDPQLDVAGYLLNTSNFKLLIKTYKTFSDWDTNVNGIKDFKNAGGKVIFYSGGVDVYYSIKNMRKEYAEIVSANGGLANTRDFARFYEIPGLAHCYGGPGPSQGDWLTEIENWVDSGTPPEAVRTVSTEALLGNVKTGLACPTPEKAQIIDPNGDIFDSNNYQCVDPENE